MAVRLPDDLPQSADERLVALLHGCGGAELHCSSGVAREVIEIVVGFSIRVASEIGLGCRGVHRVGVRQFTAIRHSNCTFHGRETRVTLETNSRYVAF